MIFLDTHVLLWWIADDTNLPASVKKYITAHRKSGILVSSMSFWEIALLVKKGRLSLGYDVRTWTEKVLSLEFLKVVPPDPFLLIESVMLSDFHKDPADRIIAATSLKMGAVLVTKDNKLRTSPHLKTYWRD